MNVLAIRQRKDQPDGWMNLCVALFGLIFGLDWVRAQESAVPIPDAPSPEHITTHWGDLGDGTYRNPVLNGDFADSDIERDGDRWVMITSTNHLTPGMTLLESRDLVNWRYLGHVWSKLNWDARYNANRMDGYRWGVWAGDLVQRDGEWLCYQIDYQNGLYMSKAARPEGPWSDPVCLLKKSKWTDPAVHFDEENRQAWLVANFGKRADGKTHDIRLFRMNWEGDQLLDQGTVIHSGPYAEAAKIRRFNGRWYIMLIEWIGEGELRDRKQVCLRSKTDSLEGPYERKIVFERASTKERSVCQGSLVQDSNEQWWFYHQLVQNGQPVFHGRPQCLQPVRWVRGWPQIGIDRDRDGIGEPVWQYTMPASHNSNSGSPAWSLQTSDEFSSEILGPQWNWNHNPRDGRWSLTERPGWLRLTACLPTKTSAGTTGGFWQAANTLSQRQLGTEQTKTIAKFDIGNMQPGGRGGLCHHSGRYALFGIHVESDGTRRLFFSNNGRVQLGPSMKATTVYLRSDTERDTASFSWSLNGQRWQKTRWKTKLTFGNWRGNRPGLFHWNEETDTPSQSGHLDCDWFRYDAPRLPTAKAP